MNMATAAAADCKLDENLQGRVRKKKKNLLPGSAVVLRVAPPPPPVHNFDLEACCANCSNCYLGLSCERAGKVASPPPDLPEKRAEKPPPVIPEKKPNNLFIANNLSSVSNSNWNRGNECSEGPMLSGCSSFSKWPRRQRKKAVVCAIGGLCFLIGLAVPLMFRQFYSSSSGSEGQRTFPFGPAGTAQRHQRILPHFEKDDYKVDSVLNDLFISVKTTKKYHHPRLVILLETWVSLVKSQVNRDLVQIY